MFLSPVLLPASYSHHSFSPLPGFQSFPLPVKVLEAAMSWPVLQLPVPGTPTFCKQLPTFPQHYVSCCLSSLSFLSLVFSSPKSIYLFCLFALRLLPQSLWSLNVSKGWPLTPPWFLFLQQNIFWTLDPHLFLCSFYNYFCHWFHSFIFSLAFHPSNVNILLPKKIELIFPVLLDSPPLPSKPFRCFEPIKLIF